MPDGTKSSFHFAVRIDKAGRGECCTYSLPALVILVHVEDMEDGGHGELILVREKERVDAVNQLGAGRHGHLLRVAIEDVERQGGHESVANSKLLAEYVRGIDL